jgi:hypothetical protein
MHWWSDPGRSIPAVGASGPQKQRLVENPSDLSVGFYPLERRQADWQRSSRCFASNFITLSSAAIPVRVILL